ncbi:MAG TPA: hypothetical protein VMF59_16475 [Bacteroidota bacterium]|nr:hypothetical protein [Bacteroidota bacterium]
MRASAGILLALILVSHSLHAAGPGIAGTWTFVPAKSTDIASWGYSVPQIEVTLREGSVRVIHDWLEKGNVAYADTFAFRPGGEPSVSVTRSEVWPENWYMGVLASVGAPRTVSGLWLRAEESLRVTSRQVLRTSQGTIAVTTTREYTLGPEGATLTLTEQRSSRPTPVVLVFERREPSK